MAFSDDVTIADSTPADIVYSLVSLTGGVSLRRASAYGLRTPRELSIMHSKTKSGLLRHTVKLSRINEDADGNLGLGSVSLTMNQPEDAIDASDLEDMVTQVVNFLTAANVTKLINGEP